MILMSRITLFLLLNNLIIINKNFKSGNTVFNFFKNIYSFNSHIRLISSLITCPRRDYCIKLCISFLIHKSH